jgi:anti-sigma factor RsiW
MSERELKLQAYLDNELGPEEAREVANWLAQDQDAVALLHTLRATRQALSTFEIGVRVPESREFYWSRIRRQIEQAEAAQPVAARPSWIAQLRRFLAPATAVALLVIAGVVVTRDVSWTPATAAETALTDAKAFTYRDYNAGTTLVWLSYPADQEMGGSGNF